MKLRKVSQRSLMLLLALMLGISMFAGCKKNTDGDSASTTGESAEASSESEEAPTDSGMVSDVPVTFTMFYQENSTYPYLEDWMIMEEIKKRTNVTLDLQLVPSSDFRDSRTIAIGAGEIPDIVAQTFDDEISTYLNTGLFLPISDYFDKLPVFTNLADRLGYNADLENLKDADGKLYVLPAYCNDEKFNAHGWLIRMDILEELGLEQPKTMEDVYELCKAYKNAYPDKPAPMTNRFFEDNILFKVAPAFNTAAGWGIGNTFFYDKEQDNFIFAPASEGYKQMLVWFNKMFSEGLLDQEFATLDSTVYENRAMDGDQFIMVDWIGNEIRYNRDGPTNSGNPNFNIQPIMPPKGPWGHWSGARVPMWDQSMCFSSKVKDYDTFDTFLKFIDWMYTDEAAELTTFGLEGETFEVLPDGRKEYIDLTHNYSTSHGILNNCLTFRKDPDYLYSNKTDYTMGLIKDMVKEGVFSPILPKIKLTEEERETESLYYGPVRDYVRAATLQFILGELSIENDWDEFVAQCNSIGVPELDELYNNRWKLQNNK